MLSKEMLDKLDLIVTKEPSKWKEKAEFRTENMKWIKHSQAVVLKILRTIRGVC